MTDIKEGDRVKVTIEGTVTYVGERWVTVDSNHDIETENATIEKIEPPVEAFKPGDVVRWKFNGVDVILLGDDGYTYLSNGRYFDFDRPGARRRGEFTSEFYERVTLVEPPL